jgi:predicted nucleic acid-binding protein
MLVLDTSAALAALAGRDPDPALVARLSADGDLHAPHLIDVELLHALRRLCASGRLSTDRAHDTRTDFAELAIVRYPHEALADRIWLLRHNLSAYDATFVALAEALDAPLVTCDARLAAAPGHDARVELFPAR